MGLFILFLAPTYSPILIASIVAERYIYFSSISLSIVVALLYEKSTLKYKKAKIYIQVILVGIILAYGIRTILRNTDYKTPERFWLKTVEASPSSWSAHNNLGENYFKNKNIHKAIEEFKKVIELNSNHATAYNNLGSVYGAIGRQQEAVPFYNKAIALKPNYALAHYNLAIAYYATKQYDLAIEHYDKAIELGYTIDADFSKLLEPFRKKR